MTTCLHKNTKAIEPVGEYTMTCNDCGVFLPAPGANLARKAIDIGRACMPLVRLLQQDGLSWADREAIASAIQNNLRIHRDMEAEQRHLQGGGATEGRRYRKSDLMGTAPATWSY
jgi:hypothetical protein